MDPRLARQQQQQAHQSQSGARPVSSFNVRQPPSDVAQPSQALSEAPRRQAGMSPKQEAPQQQAQQKQKVPEGPLKRNKWLQENESDVFQPRYQLAFGLPEIPVRPKLFKYRLDTQNRTSKYEFTTVELNQNHEILVDYNMGVRVDLIDRAVYGKLPSEGKQVEENIFSERDKFLLSDRETIPTIKAKPLQETKKHDNQAVPLKRQLSEQPIDFGNMVFSGTAGTGPKNLEKAVDQIMKTFSSVKRLKVGAQKPGDPSVTAVSVSEVLPHQFAGLVHQFSTVVNDDEIGDRAEKAAGLPNGLMLHKYVDLEGENRQALYYGNDSQHVPSDVASQILGKRARNYDLIKESHIRDYTYSEVRGGTKGEKQDYMLVKVGDQCQYVPVVSKIKLNKKRQAVLETLGSDGEPVATTDKQVSQIFIAPRGLTNEDRKSIALKANEHKMSGLRFPDSAVMFTDKDQLEQAQSSVVNCVKEIFKHVEEEEEEQEIDLVKAAGAGEEDIMMDQPAENNEASEEEDLFAPSADEQDAKDSHVSEDNIF